LLRTLCSERSKNSIEIATIERSSSFTLKPLLKLGIKGTYPSIVRSIYMTNSQIIASTKEKVKSFSSKISNEARMLTLTTSIQYNTGCPSQSIQARKRNKNHPNKKRINKIASVCRQHNHI
jgi:hypothetical protein